MTRIACFAVGCLVIVVLGAWRVVAVMRQLENPPSPETRVFRGTIADDPVHSMPQDSIIVRLDGSKSLVLARGRAPNELRYGDRIRLEGKTTVPEGGWGKSLKAKGIAVVVDRATVTLEQPGPRGALRLLYEMKRGMRHVIERLYPEPSAGLLAGLLTGDRDGIAKSESDAFRRSGLTHILAISGYNITLVLAVIGSLLFFLPFRWRFGPSVVAVIAFAILAGASASVVRAAIMGVLQLAAAHAGREKSMRLLILWTLWLMAMWNPLSLWYDAGLQLSFLAVVGLCELTPVFEKALRRLPSFPGLREALSVTLAAQCFAVPWTAFLFGDVSLVSLPANLLVAPAIPVAMAAGGLSLVAGSVSDPAGQLIAILGWMALEWICLVARTLSSLPFAALENVEIPTWAIVAYYASLFVAIRLMPRFTTRIPEFSCGPPTGRLPASAASTENGTCSR